MALMRAGKETRKQFVCLWAFPALLEPKKLWNRDIYMCMHHHNRITTQCIPEMIHIPLHHRTILTSSTISFTAHYEHFPVNLIIVMRKFSWKNDQVRKGFVHTCIQCYIYIWGTKEIRCSEINGLIPLLQERFHNSNGWSKTNIRILAVST